MGKRDIPRKGKKQSVRRDGPKRPLSAYMFFSISRRETLRDERPDLHIFTMSKVIGAEWREMVDDEKAPYVLQAEHDKERYNREMNAYKDALDDYER